MASVTGETRTRRQMIDNLTLGIRATSSWTRVLALGSDASSSGRAIRAHDALWTTALVRVAKIVGQTGARTYSVLLFANGVRATG